MNRWEGTHGSKCWVASQSLSIPTALLGSPAPHSHPGRTQAWCLSGAMAHGRSWWAKQPVPGPGEGHQQGLTPHHGSWAPAQRSPQMHSQVGRGRVGSAPLTAASALLPVTPCHAPSSPRTQTGDKPVC